MKQEFISQSGNSSLIILFAGWGMSASPFRYLHQDDCDIMVVWEYTDTSFDPSVLDSYDNVYLFAWSFGVFMASLVMERHGITPTMKIAVNGSTHPIDNNLGIPEEIYRGTLDHLNQRNLEKFYRRMCASRDTYDRFMDAMPKRDIEDLRNELAAIERHYTMNELADSRSGWDRVIIADNDRIFPPDNLLREWNENNRVRTIISGHLPDWQVLIEQEIIDKNLVKEKFNRSAPYYDDNATVQRNIAAHLQDLWKKYTMTAPESVLEVGYGTGLLTRMYTALWQPSRLVLWDLAPQPLKGLSTETVTGDAETLIADVPEGTFDAIVSASCVQWFHSLHKFLDHASRAVKPGGLIVLSTFGPENLAEVTTVTHFPLRYYSKDELRAMTPQNCDIEVLEEEKIRLDFPSPRHVMSHLRNTGVNALRHATMTVAEFTQLYPVTGSVAPLTYHPIYIILKKHCNE